MKRTFEDFKEYVGTEQRFCKVLDCYFENDRSYYHMQCSLCTKEFDLYAPKAFIGKCTPCRCDKDLSGQTFGELYVFAMIKGTGKWACRCSCGGLTAATRPTLLKSDERDYPASCGCMKRAMNPLFPTYSAMLQRCNNLKSPGYKNYGGRGIKVCDRWSDPIYGFRNFIEDMTPKPDGLSLDRIDNNGNYTPENCRWTDQSTQTRNQRVQQGRSSKYKGAHFLNKYKNPEKAKPWRALLMDNGYHHFLGLYKTELEAALAYDEKARELGFEEAWLNFPKE